MFIAVEHLLGKGKEADCGHIIILQHHALVHMTESPLLGDIFRGVASVVALLIHALHLAVPVHVLHHLSAGHDTWHIGIVSGSILIQEQARGSCQAYLFKHPAQLFRTIEKQYEHGDVHLIFFHHSANISYLSVSASLVAGILSSADKVASPAT